MSQTLLALESFLALSEAMLGAARAQEWDNLGQFGEQRGQLADKFSPDLAARLPHAEQARGRAIIERCLQLDAQTYALVDERQTALRILLREPAPVI